MTKSNYILLFESNSNTTVTTNNPFIDWVMTSTRENVTY